MEIQKRDRLMDGHLTWVVARVTCLSKNKQMQYKETQSNAQKGLRQGIQGNKQIVIKFRKKSKYNTEKKQENAQIGLRSDREYRETSKC